MRRFFACFVLFFCMNIRLAVGISLLKREWCAAVCLGSGCGLIFGDGFLKFLKQIPA